MRQTGAALLTVRPTFVTLRVSRVPYLTSTTSAARNTSVRPLQQEVGSCVCVTNAAARESTQGASVREGVMSHT